MTKPNKCLTSTETYMWQPGKIATHIPPVIEIEETISKLSTIVKDLSASASAKTTTQSIPYFARDLRRDSATEQENC